MVNFLKGVSDPHIREHTFFLLYTNLCLMVEVPTTAAYLQENEHGGPPIFFLLLDMAASIRRTSEGSRRSAHLDTIFKDLMDGPNRDYRSEPSAPNKYLYSWFRRF